MPETRITVPTSQGEAEAIRPEWGAAWEIGYPWGDDRFYGSSAEVEARMRRAIAEHDSEATP